MLLEIFLKFEDEPAVFKTAQDRGQKIFRMKKKYFQWLVGSVVIKRVKKLNKILTLSPILLINAWEDAFRIFFRILKMNQRCPVVSKPIQVNLRNRELSFILFEEKSRVLPKPAQLPLSKYQRNRILILRDN